LAPSYFTELVSLQIPRRSGIQSETDALKLIVVPSARKKSVVGVLLRVVHLEFGTTSSSLWGLSTFSSFRAQLNTTFIRLAFLPDGE
jgi:hypothetical protein